MYYICIEDNKVCGISGYLPNVPATVSVHTITDAEYATLTDRRHWFDATDLQIKMLPDEELAKVDQSDVAATFRSFLQETDWKVLRHIREKALNLTTSLTEEEYIALEHQRQQAAKQV